MRQETYDTHALWSMVDEVKNLLARDMGPTDENERYLVRRVHSVVEFVDGLRDADPVLVEQQPEAPQASPGSVYVEFDVPRSVLRPGGQPGHAQIPSPSHPLYGRLAEKTGVPLQYPVPACNIVLVGSC